MLEPFIAALMAVCAQRLQLAVPELVRIAMMRLDVIGDAGSDVFAFAQSALAQRLRSQLSASASVPKRFVVKLTHPSSLFARPRTH
jgi:hypothetical protein